MVESGVVYLGFGELLAKETQKLPVLAYLLLRTAPTWVSEASVARARTARRRGWARGTVATKAALTAAKAVSMSGFQGRALGLPRNYEVW